MYKALAVMVVLLLASPVGAVWREGSGATDTQVTNLALKPGKVVYWISSATEDTDVLNLSDCPTWTVQMLESATGTPVYLSMPQICADNACADTPYAPLDMMSSALNGGTVAGAEFQGMDYMQVEITESSGTGSSLNIVSCNGFAP